ncbi:serine/arginine-rich SC35-like splicing factor SCL33 [Cucurbita maxima]|uniref:Serine/arginine-rich SC35-like splicing factor SCL33 n=1 Tax=Cucurbita maxima TaxID=3661 RepID=A0A6J1IZ48_CUCMA|nr:serine/arginine-rich SC35-like splicing factor SCL33 [Cucurbita maxima]
MRGRSYSPSPPRIYGRRHRSPSPRDCGGRSTYLPTSLLVRNLRHDCRPEDLRGLFGRFGPLKDIYLPRDYYSGGRSYSYKRSPLRYSQSPHSGRKNSHSPEYYPPRRYSR